MSGRVGFTHGNIFSSSTKKRLSSMKRGEVPSIEGNSDIRIPNCIRNLGWQLFSLSGSKNFLRSSEFHFSFWEGMIDFTFQPTQVSLTIRSTEDKPREYFSYTEEKWSRKIEKINPFDEELDFYGSFPNRSYLWCLCYHQRTNQVGIYL